MQQEQLDEQDTEILQNLGALIIFQQIKEAQQNYGLQHGDYKRYRTYCTNRVTKLRKQMNFSFGKRFQKKAIQEDIKNDPRVLQVLLFRAEKNWAHAMSLKQLINSGISKKINKRKTKTYLVKKLKRSIQHAKQLHTLCDERTEKRTSLEADAYTSYLKGLYCFETEKWEQAIDSFVKCYNIYEQILKICDSYSSGMYQERLETLNQQIRYCNARAKKAATLSVEDLLKMQQNNIDPTLGAKLEEMLEEQRNANLSKQQGSFEIVYQDSTYALKNEKVIKLIQRIQENKQMVDLDNLDKFIQLFSYFDEALKLVKIDKDQSTSEQEKEIHNRIISYLNYQRQCAVLDRNELHIKLFTQKFIKEGGIHNLANMQTKKAQKLKLTTPQEIIKYCDNYQQTLRVIMDEERFSKDICLFKILDAKEYFGKAVRCFFAGCLYFTNEKYRESYSLLSYSSDLVRICDRKYIENKLEPNILLKEIVSLSKEVQSKSKLMGLKQQTEQIKTVGQEIVQMTLEEDKKELTLFEMMDKTELVTLDNIQQFKPADLTILMEPLPPKPIQLDIAFTYLNYPILEEQKKGGFWGKLNIFKKQ